MSSPRNFLISTETLVTASRAISCSLPVAMILPSSLDWAGVISAIMGSTIPESPITARPLTLPTSSPEEWNML